MAERTGAEWVIESLRAEGVTHVFGVIGSGVLEILDALQRTSDIRYIQTVHEQCAAAMADGWARVTGRPGVCIATVGPGATNLVSGVAQAYQESSPVIALCGEVSTKFVGKGFSNFHEIDQVGLFKTITKRSMYLHRTDRIPEMMQMAFRTALTGRKGPVYVGLPRDVQRGRADLPDLLPTALHRPLNRPRGDAQQIREAVRLLTRAQRPVILAGGGIRWSGALAELQALAEYLAIPVAVGKQHKGLFPEDHPLSAGHVQSEGYPIGKETVRQSDLILAVGSTMSELTTARYGHTVIPPDVPIIHVDIDPLEIGKSYPVAAGIVGDCAAVLADLLAAVQESDVARRQATPWSESVQQRKEAFWARQATDAASMTGSPVRRLRLFQEVRAVVEKDAIVIGEAGNTHEWFLYAWQATAPTLSPGDFSIMGSGYCMGLAAKLAHPERQVISFTGDGAFTMVMNELSTALYHNLPVVAVVPNNGMYASIKAKQHSHYGGRHIGSDLPMPNLAAVARAMGAHGERVGQGEDVGPAVQRALASGLPAVVEVMVERDVANLEPVRRSVEDALHL